MTRKEIKIVKDKIYGFSPGMAALKSIRKRTETDIMALKSIRKRTETEGPNVNEAEAAFLMAHALRMAGIYYQCINEKTGDDWVKRTITSFASYKSDPLIKAGHAFVDAIAKEYKKLEERQGP